MFYNLQSSLSSYCVSVVAFVNTSRSSIKFQALIFLPPFCLNTCVKEFQKHTEALEDESSREREKVKNEEERRRRGQKEEKMRDETNHLEHETEKHLI